MTLKPLQHRLSALCRATGWLGAVALVTLTGCAGYSPASLQPGQTAEQVRAVMGPPTGEHALPDGGRRLEYARGPAGLQTYMVDLDAQGRMTGWTQVLNDAAFARIQPGWSREQLQREFGRPAQEQVFGRLGQRVWSYRYDSWDCSWLQVSLDLRSDAVVDVGRGPDPRCQANDNHWD
jgi:hypothetical protein